MKTILIKVVLCCFLLNVVVMKGQNLKSHTWKNRVLLIYTSDENNGAYKKQLKEFEGLINEFKERKIVVYTIVKDIYLFTDYGKEKTETTWKPIKSLNQKLNAKKPFEIVLIGLDGGRKMQKNTLLTKEELIPKIDAMPMRRNELSED